MFWYFTRSYCRFTTSNQQNIVIWILGLDIINIVKCLYGDQFGIEHQVWVASDIPV